MRRLARIDSVRSAEKRGTGKTQAAGSWSFIVPIGLKIAQSLLWKENWNWHWRWRRWLVMFYGRIQFYFGETGV